MLSMSEGVESHVNGYVSNDVINWDWYQKGM